MKTIIFITLLLAISSCTNPLKCIEDAVKIAKDVELFINDAKSGKDVSSLISDIQTVVADVQAALPDCGGQAFETKVNFGDISSCISDINNLVQLALKLKTDVDNKDISSLINDGLQFVQLGKQAIADCESGITGEKADKIMTRLEGFNPLKCIQDGLNLVKDVNNFINDAQSGKDITSLISDIQSVMSDIQTTIPDCGGSIQSQTETKVGDIASCISDVKQLVTLAEKLKSDVSNKDISSLINDGLAFVNLGKQAIADCKQIRLEAFNPIQCIKDGVQVSKDVEQFINDAKSKKDITSLISDIEAAIGDIKTAMTDCGAKMPEVETKMGDISSCISDIEGLVKLGLQLKTDVQNKDISSLINDGMAFITQGKQAIADCKAMTQSA